MAATDLIANSGQESQCIALEGGSKECLFEIWKMNEIECHFYNILGISSSGVLITI